MQVVTRFVILPKLLADRFGGCILFGMEYLKIKMFYCKHQLMTENWYDKHLLKMCIKFNQVLSHFSNIVTADVTLINFFEPVWFFLLGFIIPLENFSLIWKRRHYRWRTANFDLCCALMAIEQWGFFSVPHLLWHGASVYNGLLRGPVTLTRTAERLAVERSLPEFTT